ncbi:MAG: PAAR domain-containing protein [Cyanobacteria bacterium J06635_10]
MSKPAARITDPVAHPLPPVLTGGTGSPTVLIGGLPAWRGMPAVAVADLMNTVKESVENIAKADLAAASGNPIAQANAVETKIDEAKKMAEKITGMAAQGVDIHACATPLLPPLPLPIHGPGVVITGSATVLINGLPACRMGDTIQEAIGPPNSIVMGCPTVQIGG